MEEGPDRHQNLISSLSHHLGPLHKFHYNPFIIFLIMLLTHKQTNKQTNATGNITSFVKEVVCKTRNILNFLYDMKLTVLNVHANLPEQCSNNSVLNY